MFERLTQQLLSKFLSKYFTEESISNNSSKSSSLLGVWSGYVSLKNLVLKKEAINAKLQTKGLPIEIVHCSFRQVEITIPWAKLSNPIGLSKRSGSDDAVVVVVLDGIHLLARTNFEFNDTVLRKEEVKKRRNTLRTYSQGMNLDEELSYKDVLKKRLKDGLLQEIASKVHIHLRDLHIRLEDAETDPMSPFACGITLESMHIQHDDKNESSGVVAKMAQLHHLTVYWNALGYDEGLPAENSILHQTCRGDIDRTAALLDSSINRRADILASPAKSTYIPKHSYLLLPVDGTWRGHLSTNPKDLSSKPAADIIMTIDPVFGQLRDFQCLQMLRLIGEYKNHKYVKKYRQFRPSESVMKNPGAWWRYAARAIRFQLRESFLRSGWGKFEHVYRVRNRYMLLYERYVRFSSDQNIEEARRTKNELNTDTLSRSQLESSTSKRRIGESSTTPDEGAGLGAPQKQQIPLSQNELCELVNIEDGLVGGISTKTILLCRLLVNLRLGRKNRMKPEIDSVGYLSTSLGPSVIHDSEVKGELNELLSFIEKFKEDNSGPIRSGSDLVAVSIIVKFEELNLSFLSPLLVTREENPLRQIHEKFLTLSIKDMRFGFCLKGDYDGKEYRLSIFDFAGTEIRRNMTQHTIIRQIVKVERRDKSFAPANGVNDLEGEPAIMISYSQKAKSSTGTDVDLVCRTNALELTLEPTCEWIVRLKSLRDQVTQVRNVSDFWKKLSFAYVNSLALGRLGIVAKAEAASTDHKNISADIFLQCPIVLIGDGKGGHLIVDLGVAQLKTLKLAAKSSAEAVQREHWNNHSEGSDYSPYPHIDDSSAVGSLAGRTWTSKYRSEKSSIRKRNTQKSTLSSSLSIVSHNKLGFGSPSMAGSLDLDESLTRIDVREGGIDEEGKEETKAMSRLFYDVFSLVIKTGKISFCSDCDNFDISIGLRSETIIEKSVLPADHTICKMKMHTVVEDMQVVLTESIIFHLIRTACSWRYVTHDKAKRNLHEIEGDPEPNLESERLRIASSHSFDENTSSHIDENEFFDTIGQEDSFEGNHSTNWFEDAWISDAESIIESDSRSATGRHTRRSKGRRAGSVSDMSSVSDYSGKDSIARDGKNAYGNAYLSAENLARLEEGVSEDESMGDNLIEMGDESFHSVMSEGEQHKVASELDQTIIQAMSQEKDLESQLKKLALNKTDFGEGERERQRELSKLTRLELTRVQAEINGLRALRSEMEVLMDESGKHEAEGNYSDAFSVSHRNAHAKATKALLGARRRRNLMLSSNGLHTLTKDLNPELFQGSLRIRNCKLSLHTNHKDAQSAESRCFDFVATESGFTVFREAKSTKLYLSSDYISFSCFEQTASKIQPVTLFSGGNADNYLPSQFPHLFSRSMEDRFLRIAVHLGKRGTSHSRQEMQTKKGRIVIGDIEIFPHGPCVSSLNRLMNRLKNEKQKNHAESLQEHASAPKTSFEVMQKDPIFTDWAIRISSARMVLSCDETMTGAIAVTELAARLIQVAAQARQRVQIDARCTNLQMLDISRTESHHGLEIIGRRDPYSLLLHLRVRSELVPESNCGGWVVGSIDKGVVNGNTKGGRLVKNIHAGLKANPISICAHPKAIRDLGQSIKELKTVLRKPEGPSLQKVPGFNQSRESILSRMAKLFPLRWRVDVIVKKVFVDFPEESADCEFIFNEDVESRMKASVSLACSIEESLNEEGRMLIRSVATDFSLTRPKDDLQIVEPLSSVFELSLDFSLLQLHKQKMDKKLVTNVRRLKLEPGSALNEIASVLHRHGWDSIHVKEDISLKRNMALRSTALKVNLTAKALHLIVDVIGKLKKSQHDSPPTNVSSRQNDKSVSFDLFIPSVDVEIRRDLELRQSSHVKSLLLFSVIGIIVEYKQQRQIKAAVVIHNSSLFDLSSSKAVQVIGENGVRKETENPPFVRIEVNVNKNLAGPTFVRLEIRWGSIQCLVVPSFLKSILAVKGDWNTVFERSRKTTTLMVPPRKKDSLEKIVTFDQDIHLGIFTHADSFECIFPSRDITEYVRSGDTSAIGVVTLRWKASLSISLAFDSLKGLSSPWLDLDGKLTDSRDKDLFKDFITRYLSSSFEEESFVKKQDCEILNGFTARFGLFVSDFQVIRTTIFGEFIKRHQRKDTYSIATRICFSVTPPVIGEQRVTNPIGVDIVLRTVGSTVIDRQPEENDVGFSVEVSHLLEIDAKVVDVLLYISQSTGGFTESFKTTIKPIIDIFKEKESRHKKPETKQRRQRKNLIETIKSGSTVCMMSLEGLQITCVPGGATQLNESPIIKIELSKLSSGFAATPLMIPGADVQSRSSTNLLASSDQFHMILAGWIQCGLSGHYHNRRLVAWEPFLEPWTVNVRVGVDAVESLGLSPMLHPSDSKIVVAAGSGEAHESKSASSTGDSKGDRLRDFGRLFRTPFKSAFAIRTVASDQEVMSHRDFSYLLLASACRTTIVAAMCASRESIEEKEARLFSNLPSREKLDWLASYGFPGRETGNISAATFVLSDSKPLNVNVTGALLENLLGYIHSMKSGGLQSVAPHWIRNDCGMTVRFREILDNDRLRRGEQAKSVQVATGSEMPLTLKRSLSQTCDPHRAYIHLEIGSFEDTVGRIRKEDFDLPKGALSSSFFFKAASKIPVDTVGVHRFPLDRNTDTRNEGNNSNSDSRTFGWIIVRVALRDGAKVVFVESPFVLKSTANIDLVCEIRDFNGLSLLWRCLMPKLDRRECNEDNGRQVVPVPADIVPFLHSSSYTFTLYALPRNLDMEHESELTSPIRESHAIHIIPPPPFSTESLARGLLRQDEVTLKTIDPVTGGALTDSASVTICSFRIGNFSGLRGGLTVPEQRIMLFRSPISITNCLSLPIAIQARVKDQGLVERNDQMTAFNSSRFTSDWEDLGVLECGELVNWTGATSADKVQLRARFVGTDGDNSRKFPDWSTTIVIPERDITTNKEARGADVTSNVFGSMRVEDADGIPLDLSVAFDLDLGTRSIEALPESDIKTLSKCLSGGTRAISIFVPYWIVDSTNQDLEFISGTMIAGQLGGDIQPNSHINETNNGQVSLGLAELLDNETFLTLPPDQTLELLMLGKNSATRLMLRKRLSRQNRTSMKRYAPPWCDAISLQDDRPSVHDVTALSPKFTHFSNYNVDEIQTFDRFSLRIKVIKAPDRFGGIQGTKVIHVMNRYSILNETGRDLEISSEFESGSSVTVRGTAIPQAFHYDDTGFMRLRFKEFGWSWSGKFSIRQSRPEVTMRLRHKMKALAVIVAVELVEKKGATSVLILRQSNHPPFRLENHTMFPLLFGQSTSRIGSEDSEVDSMLLPYQNADFAWEEPEVRRCILVLRTTNNPHHPHGACLGRFQVDTIAPGTLLSLDSTDFAGELVADGPTRVLRITDASMPSLSRQDGFSDFQKRISEQPRKGITLHVKLLHGVGISIVDWSPQELLYVRLEDIQIERKVEENSEKLSLSLGNMKWNNQLWVTPYPVLLKMGRRVDTLNPIRKKNRRHDAFSIFWKRLLDTQGSFGNVTLLESVEISSEPVFVNVDGQVADLLLKMLRQATMITRHINQVPSSLSRDEELRKDLDMAVVEAEEAETIRRGFSSLQQGSDGDLITTSAVASKLRAQPLPFVTVTSPPLRSPRAPRSRRKDKSSISTTAKPQHKYYIERLKISATKADLSWSGPLPGLVSSLLLRALTFERLPVLFRPYSSSHAYGNAKDHLQMMKSHYLSVWRIFDLIMGLSYNPTFLFRAIVYTSRETCASFLNAWANEASLAGKRLWSCTDQSANSYFPGDRFENKEDSFAPYSGMIIVRPFLHICASMFTASSKILSFASTRLKLDQQSNKRLATRGLVRSRNPRLFARTDGKDLLVEYVEGENAGKALLSRVRMGMHLGEGYIFHSESVRQVKPKGKSERNIDPTPYIIMVTSERVLLLTGRLDWDFCSVVWETEVANIVDLEVTEGNQTSLTNSRDRVTISYLSSVYNDEIQLDEHSPSKTGFSGIDALRHMSAFVPKNVGKYLVSKIQGISEGF